MLCLPVRALFCFPAKGFAVPQSRAFGPPGSSGAYRPFGGLGGQASDATSRSIGPPRSLAGAGFRRTVSTPRTALSSRHGGFTKAAHGRSRWAKHFSRRFRRAFPQPHYAQGSSRSFIQREMSSTGTPDRVLVKLPFKYSNSFTTTAGAIGFASVKLNDCYRPWPSVTLSAANYSTWFALYTKCCVKASSIKMRFWSDVSATADAEPFRFAIVPCTGGLQTNILAKTSVIDVSNYPHARMADYSPGAVMPALKHYMTAADAYAGQHHVDEAASTAWSISTGGAAPANPVYWVVAFQNFAGGSNQNVQFEADMEFYCEFYDNKGTATQLEVDDYGNDVSTMDPLELAEFKAAKKPSFQIADRETKATAGRKRKPEDDDVEMTTQQVKRLRVETSPGAGSGSGSGSAPSAPAATPAQSPSSAAGIYCRVFALLLCPFLLFLVR